MGKIKFLSQNRFDPRKFFIPQNGCFLVERNKYFVFPRPAYNRTKNMYIVGYMQLKSGVIGAKYSKNWKSSVLKF